MNRVNEHLNRQLASWNVLNVKLRHYHWYVTGPQFFELHAKFEELYDEAAGIVDEFAERILALQGKPLSTMKQYLEAAVLAEAAGGETAEQMVAQLADDYRTLVRELEEGIHLAQEAGDESTADIFIGKITDLQKHIWMLSAFLGRG